MVISPDFVRTSREVLLFITTPMNRPLFSVTPSKISNTESNPESSAPLIDSTLKVFSISASCSSLEDSKNFSGKRSEMLSGFLKPCLLSYVSNPLSTALEA